MVFSQHDIAHKFFYKIDLSFEKLFRMCFSVLASQLNEVHSELQIDIGTKIAYLNHKSNNNVSYCLLDDVSDSWNRLYTLVVYRTVCFWANIMRDIVSYNECE